MTTALSTLLNSNGIWSTASHNKTTLAHGVASIANHRLADGDKIRRTFVSSTPMHHRHHPLPSRD